MIRNQIAPHPILLLATYTSGEKQQVFQQFKASSSTVILKLDRLHQTAISEIVSDMLAVSPSETFCRYIARYSEGNPFFVAAYLQVAVAEGILWRDRYGQWQIGSFEDASLPLPGSLEELITRQLNGLPGPALTFIKAAAILGREANTLLLWDLTNLSDEVLLDVAEELIDDQIIERSKPGWVRFRHHQIRAVTL
ncbi:hypothetical protein ACFL27_19100, partial [candidate division CSSED10-310 bacterium]